MGWVSIRNRIKPESSKLYLKSCENCSQEFVVDHEHKKTLTCSNICRYMQARKKLKGRIFTDPWKEKISLNSKIPKSEDHKLMLSLAAYQRKRPKNKSELYDKLSSDQQWWFNRKVCLERDSYRCRHCGTNKSIEVHHIDPYRLSRNNALENLITLCVSCHSKSEKGKRPNTHDKVCGVILAGGKGTRLLPFTQFLNKHELPVGRCPMIFHSINTLRELKITNIRVILDSQKPGNIINLLTDGEEFGVDICYSTQRGPGGIAEALLGTEDFVGNKTVFVILADNIFQPHEFTGFPSFYTKGLVYIKKVKNSRLYGVPTIKKNRIVGVEEKPLFPKSKYAITGLYAYKPSVFSILKTLTPSKRDELELSDLNNILAKNNDLSFKEIKGYWYDVGNSIENYITVNYLLLKRLKEEK